MFRRVCFVDRHHYTDQWAVPPQHDVAALLLVDHKTCALERLDQIRSRDNL